MRTVATQIWTRPTAVVVLTRLLMVNALSPLGGCVASSDRRQSFSEKTASESDAGAEKDPFHDFDPDDHQDSGCTFGAAGTCAPGSTIPCYEGTVGPDVTNFCKGGVRTCNYAGTSYGPCTGQALPRPNDCRDPSAWICDGAFSECGKMVRVERVGIAGLVHKSCGLVSVGADAVVHAYVRHDQTGSGELRVDRLGTVTEWSAIFPWVTDDVSNIIGPHVALAVGSDGAIVFGGYLDGHTSLVLGDTAVGGPAAFVAKLSPTGKLLWSKGFSPARIYESGVGLGSDGSVFLVGSLGESLSTKPATLDYGSGVLSTKQGEGFVVKLDPNGNVLWAILDDSLGGSGFDAVASDVPGNVYVTGYQRKDLPQCDSDAVLVASYDGAGRFRWKRTFRSDLVASVGASIVATGDGHLYVSGRINDLPGAALNFGGDTFDGRTFLVKLTALDGAHVWSTSTDDAIVGYARGGFVAVDPWGNVVWASQDSFSPRIRKYDPDGHLLWSKYFLTSSGGVIATGTSALAIQPTGNIVTAFVVGGSIDLPGTTLEPVGTSDVALTWFLP